MTKPQTDLEELKAAREREHRETFDRPVDGKLADETVNLTPEQVKASSRRNLWIALSVAAFFVLVFFITMAKVGDSIAAGAS
jgi:hypothetical protein